MPPGVNVSARILNARPNVTVVLLFEGSRPPDSVQVGHNADTGVFTVATYYRNFRWTGPDEVLFESGYNCGPLCGSAEYRAVRTGAILHDYPGSHDLDQLT